MVHRCPSLRLVCLPVSRRKSPKSNNQDRTNGLETTTESDSRQTRWLDCLISIREAISFCAPTKRGPGLQKLPGVGKAFLSHPASFQIRYIFGPKRYVSVIGGLRKHSHMLRKHSHMFSEFLVSYRHWKIYNLLLLWQKRGRNGLKMLFHQRRLKNYTRPHIHGLKKKIKSFGMTPPSTSGHGTTSLAPLG